MCKKVQCIDCGREIPKEQLVLCAECAGQGLVEGRICTLCHGEGILNIPYICSSCVKKWEHGGL